MTSSCYLSRLNIQSLKKLSTYRLYATCSQSLFPNAYVSVRQEEPCCSIFTHIYIWIDWHMIFGLEQEGGSLIAPMALAHPLHPIDNRSRTRRRNLWVGWCVSSWWPLFPSRSSVLIYIYIHIYILLYELCFLWLTNCVLLSDDNRLIPGCLWLLAFVLNNTLILDIWCSTIPHLPGCFCPWTFFQTIGFNMVPLDSFMSHIAIQFEYSAGEFQALQLIVLATFGVVD